VIDYFQGVVYKRHGSYNRGEDNNSGLLVLFLFLLTEHMCTIQQVQGACAFEFPVADHVAVDGL
jgi:hypothetical protein